MRSVPPIAILLGAAGLLPFIAGSYGALSFDGDAARISLLGLAAYGAVILAFLGGVHWGFGLDAGSTQTIRTQRLRFGLGVVPSLIGWAGLLVTFAGFPKIGLLVLLAGFIGTTIAEARGTQEGLVPQGYMLLRWVLSVIVILCLVMDCLVLTLGGRVVL